MPIWLIVIFAVFSAASLYAVSALNKKQRKFPAQAALSSYIAFSLIFLSIWILHFLVPPYVVLLAMLAVFINCFFGYYLDWFNRSMVFDRYLHAYGSFSFALLAYSLIQNLFETGGSKTFQSLFVFTTGMALGAIFELIEARSDYKKGTNNQRGLQDTDMDLLGDLIGSMVAGVFAYLYLL